MKSLWNDTEAQAFLGDPLQERIYTSQLLGRDPSLVLHGGGNTSLKATAKNIFGEEEEVLYVKGSGWDLATINESGFSAVRLDALTRMAQLEQLSDTAMVRGQRAAMLDPGAPNPSVEAILHAVIPFRFVDHTHADAVVTISNTNDGAERIKDLYGGRVLIVPYVMPGFALARRVATLTGDLNWSRLEGIILLHHGVFTFADDARTSYERMIRIADKAESYLRQNTTVIDNTGSDHQRPVPHDDLVTVAAMRKYSSLRFGDPVVVRADNSNNAVQFSNLPGVAEITARGSLTPDHVIRAKPFPMMIGDDPRDAVEMFAQQYQRYFDNNNNGALICLDLAPRWAVWPGRGVLAFGRSVRDADAILDIVRHTTSAILRAEQLGGWRGLSQSDLFQVEYWELEQAKLKKRGAVAPLQGKVALVTGAGSGIGRACVEQFLEQGAAVIGIDLDEGVKNLSNRRAYLGQICDITDERQLRYGIDRGVVALGGIDIVVNNAGVFTAGKTIADLDGETWKLSLDVNLSAQQAVLRNCIPYLRHGIQPSVIFVGSRNVTAPGPGAAAYSAAKAGATQLARVAALELARFGIRVNIVHPDGVYDTRIWTAEMLQTRARQYGMTVAQYKGRNLLQTEVTSRDVAASICALAGPMFSKTTGAQIPVDGGNDRVI